MDEITTLTTVDYHNRFAHRFYSHLTQPNSENVIFSPYSIFTAFAMMYEGAKGKTKTELKTFFRFPNEENLHEFLTPLDNSFESYKMFKIEEFKERLEKKYDGIYKYIQKRNKDIQELNTFLPQLTKFQKPNVNAPIPYTEERMLQDFSSSLEKSVGSKNSIFELQTINALWIQQGYPIEEEFKNCIHEFYDGNMFFLDFINDSENTAKIINEYVEKHTNHKLTNLIAPNNFTELTRLILTNILYFSGSWEFPFSKRSTRNKSFWISREKVIQTSMMAFGKQILNSNKFNYAELEELEILELPYKGGSLSMLIFLPSDNLKSLEKSFTFEKLTHLKNQMKPRTLGGVFLPKFDFHFKTSAKNILKSLGLFTPFSMAEADFSGISVNAVNEGLYIENCHHEAFIKVNEDGTEAGACTQMEVFMAGFHTSKDPIFNVNHPFLFIIQNSITGMILFMGKVVDPRS